MTVCSAKSYSYALASMRGQSRHKYYSEPRPVRIHWDATTLMFAKYVDKARSVVREASAPDWELSAEPQ